MRKTLVILVSMLFCMCTQSQQAVPPVLSSMDYRINDSSRFPSFHFMLRMDADHRYWLSNASGCDPDEAQTIEVPETFAEQLRQIVVEENMLAYKTHYRRLIDIQDGEFWTLNIRFADSDVSVHTSGQQAYPKGDGLQRIQQLCLDTWNQLNNL